jgi:hypothetical protein
LPYVLSMRFDSSIAFDTTHCCVPSIFVHYGAK